MPGREIASGKRTVSFCGPEKYAIQLKCVRFKGTIPFMALDILWKKPSVQVKHSAIHDAESMFYILIWIACLQGGPHNQSRGGDFSTSNSILKFWCSFEDVNDEKLRMIANFKKCQMVTSVSFDEEIIADMDPYFDDLHPYFRVLRNLFFPTLPVDAGILLPEENADEPQTSKPDGRNAHNEDGTNRIDKEQPKKKEKEKETVISARPLSEVIGVLKAQTAAYRNKLSKADSKEASTSKSSAVTSDPAGELRNSQAASTHPVSDTAPHNPVTVLPANSLDAARRQINGMRLRKFANPDGKQNAGPSPSNVTAKRSREEAFGPTDTEGFNTTSAKRSRTLTDQKQQEETPPEPANNETTNDNPQTTS